MTFHDAKLLHRHGFTTTFLSSLRPCSTFHAITRYESWECLPRLVPMPCTTRSDAFHTYMGMPSTSRGRHLHDPWKASPSGFPEVIDDQADLFGSVRLGVAGHATGLSVPGWPAVRAEGRHGWVGSPPRVSCLIVCCCGVRSSGTPSPTISSLF